MRPFERSIFIRWKPKLDRWSRARLVQQVVIRRRRQPDGRNTSIKGRGVWLEEHHDFVYCFDWEKERRQR